MNASRFSKWDGNNIYVHTIDVWDGDRSFAINFKARATTKSEIIVSLNFNSTHSRIRLWHIQLWHSHGYTFRLILESSSVKRGKHMKGIYWKMGGKMTYKLAAPTPSSISDRVKQTGHTASIGYFCIISKTDNSYDLLIHESLLLLKGRPILNSQQSSLFLWCYFNLAFSLSA